MHNKKYLLCRDDGRTKELAINVTIEMSELHDLDLLGTEKAARERMMKKLSQVCRDFFPPHSFRLVTVHASWALSSYSLCRSTGVRGSTASTRHRRTS